MTTPGRDFSWELRRNTEGFFLSTLLQVALRELFTQAINPEANLAFRNPSCFLDWETFRFYITPLPF